jgi:6,7-dimethyl-8-ribityllumazine synthase
MAGYAPEITVPKAPKARVAIISSSWHLDICNDLIAGATRALEAAELRDRIGNGVVGGVGRVADHSDAVDLLRDGLSAFA